MAWNRSNQSANSQKNIKQAHSKQRPITGGLPILCGIIALTIFLMQYFAKSTSKQPVAAAQKRHQIADWRTKTSRLQKSPSMQKVRAEIEKRKSQRVLEPSETNAMHTGILYGREIVIGVESNKIGETRLARYTNKLHQELAKYVYTGLSCDTPDPFEDKEALQLCEEAMKYNFDDPMEVLEEKKRIEELVREMKEYISQGGHANQFLMSLMERQDEEADVVRDVEEKIYDLCKNGDVEIAEKGFEKYNSFLKERGLPEVQPTELMSHYIENGDIPTGRANE